MNPKPIDQAQDEDIRQVPAVLARAAKRAREIAAMTKTAVVVVRNGQLIKESVPAANPGLTDRLP